MLKTWNKLLINPGEFAVRTLPLVLSLVLLSAGCSGGGGGGGGGSSAGRTRETALRVIHAALDGAPVSLQVNSVFHQEAKFGIDQAYVPLTEGAAAIVGVKPVTSEVIFQRTDAITKDTETTLLVYGSAAQDTLKTEMITDQILRPDQGRSFIRFYHALPGRSSTRLLCSANNSAGTAEEVTLSASYGGGSEYGELPSGTVSCRATTSIGATLATQDFIVADRSELGVVLTGSSDLNFVVLRGYTDLD